MLRSPEHPDVLRSRRRRVKLPFPPFFHTDSSWEILPGWRAQTPVILRSDPQVMGLFTRGCPHVPCGLPNESRSQGMDRPFCLWTVSRRHLFGEGPAPRSVEKPRLFRARMHSRGGGGQQVLNGVRRGADHRGSAGRGAHWIEDSLPQPRGPRPFENRARVSACQGSATAVEKALNAGTRVLASGSDNAWPPLPWPESFSMILLCSTNQYRFDGPKTAGDVRT